MRKTFQTTDGLQLCYDVQGQGMPLLCLAGLTRNMDDFEPIVDHFSDRAMIIRLDYRGRGGSDFDPNPLNYTPPQESKDTIELLDHLAIPKAAIIGTSRGGLIAMGLAAMQKQRLSGVLLNDIGPELDPRGLSHIMEYLGCPSAFLSFEDAATRLPQTMGPRFKNVSHAQWLTFARRIWNEGETRLELRYDPKLRDAFEVGDPTGTFDLWPFFDAFQDLPLALLRGENSDLLTQACADEMQSRRPDMIFANVADRGHVPFLDEPESVDVIARFIDAVEAHSCA